MAEIKPPVHKIPFLERNFSVKKILIFMLILAFFIVGYFGTKYCLNKYRNKIVVDIADILAVSSRECQIIKAKDKTGKEERLVNVSCLQQPEANKGSSELPMPEPKPELEPEQEQPPEENNN